MSLEHIQPDGIFESQRFGFTQVVTSPPGKLVFVSGQVGWDKELKLVGGSDLGSQAEQALRNLRSALEAAGATPTDVASLRVYVADYAPEDAAVVGRAVAGFFGGGSPPAQTLIGVQSLAAPGLRIEIEAFAVVGE